jgi:hypothetical protein
MLQILAEPFRQAAEATGRLKVHQIGRFGCGPVSIGLGLAEVLAPRAWTRRLRMEGNEQIVQAYGIRGIVTGIGILSSNQLAPWIWGRVGADALDLATIANGLQRDNPTKENSNSLLSPLPPLRR